MPRTTSFSQVKTALSLSCVAKVLAGIGFLTAPWLADSHRAGSRGQLYGVKVMRRCRGGFGRLLAAAGSRAPNNGSSGILLGVPPSNSQSPLFLRCVIMILLARLRHAVDADHIAAIDNVTRRLRHSQAWAPGRNSSCHGPRQAYH